MTGHGVGQAPAGPAPSASPARTAETTEATDTEVTRGGGGDARTDLDLTRPPKPGSAAVPPHVSPAVEPAPPRTAEQILMDDPWLFIKRTPEGHVARVWLVDGRDYDDVMTSELFWLEQRPGFTVSAEHLEPRTPEPVTTT